MFLAVVGVGNNPDPFPFVGGANVISSQHAPPSIVPQGGKRPKDFREAASKERGNVFHEDVARQYLRHNARHFIPKAALGT